MGFFDTLFSDTDPVTDAPSYEQATSQDYAAPESFFSGASLFDNVSDSLKNLPGSIAPWLNAATGTLGDIAKIQKSVEGLIGEDPSPTVNGAPRRVFSRAPNGGGANPQYSLYPRRVGAAALNNVPPTSNALLDYNDRSQISGGSAILLVIVALVGGIAIWKLR